MFNKNKNKDTEIKNTSTTEDEEFILVVGDDDAVINEVEEEVE